MELKFICATKNESLNIVNGNSVITSNLTFAPVNPEINAYNTGAVVGTPNAPIPASDSPSMTTSGLTLTLKGSPEETGVFVLGQTYTFVLQEEKKK